MSGRLLSPADWRVWAICYLVAAVLLVVTKFTSSDPDSSLHAAIAARLAQQPISHWIAPEWWGEWNTTGLYFEHPAGIFLLPALLASIGVPAIQAAYIVGAGASLAALLLIGHLVRTLTSRADGRAVLLLLLLMPVAFIFRIRANHEYPMLVCLLLAIVGVDGVRRDWRYTAVIALALTAAVLIKGVFVALVLLAAGLWALINPTRASGSIGRPIAAMAIGLAVMLGAAALYNHLYFEVTGYDFWPHYRNKQLSPLEVATPLDSASTLGSHLAFYLSRLLWHPAPWSLALLAIAARHWRTFGAWWRGTPHSARRGVLFGLGFAVLSVALLSPSSRFAERYTFSATFAVGTVGAVVAYRGWPALRRFVDRVDASAPAAAALVWLGLIALRLGLGPLLPRW